MTEILRVLAEKETSIVKELFVEYAKSLDFDLGFQSFDKELASLPGKFGPPTGCLLLAKYHDEYVGCVALRRISSEICEMKRLFVKPGFRGYGIGKKLVESIISEAKELGYSRMYLDTVGSMKGAIALYRAYGFREISPYTYNPIEGALFLELSWL